MARIITEALRRLGQDIPSLHDADEQLAELVSAVDSTGKGGKLTLEISIKKMSKGAMGITGKIRLSKPQEQPDATLVFPTPEGELLDEDPRQSKLPLKQVETAAPTQLKQAGAN